MLCLAGWYGAFRDFVAKVLPLLFVTDNQCLPCPSHPGGFSSKDCPLHLGHSRITSCLTIVKPELDIDRQCNHDASYIFSEALNQ
jgi:hypothetical protein